MNRQQSVRWGRGRRTRTAAGRDLAYALRACPRDAPELPSTANGRHQQQPVNLKLARALNPASNARNTLVMRRSLGDDEHQGAEVPAVVRDHRRRARCVPDRPVDPGHSRLLTDIPTCPLTCALAGLRLAAHVLLGNGSPGALQACPPDVPNRHQQQPMTEGP